MKPRNKSFGRLRSSGALRTRRVEDKKHKQQAIRGLKHKGKPNEDRD